MQEGALDFSRHDKPSIMLQKRSGTIGPLVQYGLTDPVRGMPQTNLNHADVAVLAGAQNLNMGFPNLETG